MFQIHPLSAELFAGLGALSDDERAARNIQVHISDGSFPCRVSLEDAPAGERVFLVNHEHQPAASPYRSCHAVYVREQARTASVVPGAVPVSIAARLLSVRAFDAKGNMIEADVVEGKSVAPLIEKMLGNNTVDEIHLHFARPGCFAARVTRR
ncbi:DUF1203 domain-containing protein [Roseibium sp. RKSG952]|uniref:DUF1203 domain-containing protein n=1 Tax=Roseibium sp. RKSG952 TaxID=2529384 RepID=UPI0012BBD035|nr:DUF1203 domain-containing protein [Roseibium sp. RKSG952]MTH98874.1 DUF1203 domain-containing protein [Roseibium sp. RKSG952]